MRSRRTFAFVAFCVGVSAIMLVGNSSKYGLFVACYLAFVALYLFWSTRNIASKMMAPAELNGVTHFVFTDEGYSVTSQARDSSTAWQALAKVVETKRSFLLTYANSMFVIVPKKNIASTDIAPLRALLVKRGLAPATK